MNFVFVFAFYQLISFKDAKQSSNYTYSVHGVSEGNISRGSSISVILSRLTLSDLSSEKEGKVQKYGNKELWSIKQLSGCNAARHTVLWTQVCKI